MNNPTNSRARSRDYGTMDAVLAVLLLVFVVVLAVGCAVGLAAVAWRVFS